MVRGLLKSPLHFFVSDRLLLLGYEGRRSGKLFTIVVGYAEVDSTVLVLLSNTPDRSWWRTFRSPWPATLRIRGCQRQFEGCFIEPGSSEFREAFEIMFRRFPEITGIYDTRFDVNRGLTDEQVARLALDRGAVCFRPR